MHRVRLGVAGSREPSRPDHKSPFYGYLLKVPPQSGRMIQHHLAYQRCRRAGVFRGPPSAASPRPRCDNLRTLPLRQWDATDSHAAAAPQTWGFAGSRMAWPNPHGPGAGGRVRASGQTACIPLSNRSANHGRSLVRTAILRATRERLLLSERQWE